MGVVVHKVVGFILLSNYGIMEQCVTVPNGLRKPYHPLYLLHFHIYINIYISSQELMVIKTLVSSLDFALTPR